MRCFLSPAHLLCDTTVATRYLFTKYDTTVTPASAGGVYDIPKEASAWRKAPSPSHTHPGDRGCTTAS